MRSKKIGDFIIFYEYCMHKEIIHETRLLNTHQYEEDESHHYGEVLSYKLIELKFF